MTCEQCLQVLLDSANSPACKDRMPEVSELNLAKLHAENCSTCTPRMAEISRLNDGLEQLRLSNIQAEAPKSIETNLLVEFRHRNALRTPVVSNPFRWRLAWAPAMALALVAGLIFYSVLRARPNIWVQTHETAHPAQQPPSPHHSRAGFDRTLIENQQAGMDRPQLTSAKRTSQTNLSRKPHDRTRPQEALWPAGDELSLNGGGDVVRVTLPLSSLVAMGIPIYPEVSNRRVMADVARDPFGAVISIHLVESKPSTN